MRNATHHISSFLPNILALWCLVWLLSGISISSQIIMAVLTHTKEIWMGIAIGAGATIFTYRTMLHTFIHETSHLMMSMALGHKVTQFNVSNTGGFVAFNAHSSKFFWITALAPYIFVLRLPALLFALTVLLTDNPLSQSSYCMALGALLSHSLFIIYKEIKISANNYTLDSGNDFKHLGVAKSVTLIILLNLVFLVALLAWLLPNIQVADINSVVVKNLMSYVQYATGFF